MRLQSIILHQSLAFPGVRLAINSTVEPGAGAWKEWTAHVRGPRVLLVSPKGWQPGKSERTGSESMIYDIPREAVTLLWVGSDVDKVKEWSPAAKGKPADGKAS